jgi:predicted regulator of Ras-like GTPase activity (Roadblock/LC7/MglB family)
MSIFHLKGYAPIASALFVELRILTELQNSKGVVNVQLLDENGLITLSLSSEKNQDFSSIIAVMGHSQESQSVTITSQSAILIANKLELNNLLVVQLQASCNLGSIRKLLSKAVAELNALSA